MSVIEIKNCSVLRDEKIILDNFSLKLNELEHLAILGPNGSGKSTFISLLMRENYPSHDEKFRAEVKILGRDDLSIFELRRLVSLVSPKFSENLLLASPLTVIDATASSFFGTYGFFAEEFPTKSQLKITKEVLRDLDLWKLKDNFVHELSTGELRKVLIARAMVLQPKLILLDEPTAGLDIFAQSDFLKYLNNIAAKTTIIMVTHHLEEVIPAIKKVLMIKEGKVFALGEKKEILTQKNLSELFGIEIEMSESANETYSMRKK